MKTVSCVEASAAISLGAIMSIVVGLAENCWLWDTLCGTTDSPASVVPDRFPAMFSVLYIHASGGPLAHI